MEMYIVTHLVENFDEINIKPHYSVLDAREHFNELCRTYLVPYLISVGKLSENEAHIEVIEMLLRENHTIGDYGIDTQFEGGKLLQIDWSDQGGKHRIQFKYNQI